MRHSKSSSKREVYSNKVLSQEIRKVSKNQTNLIFKAIIHEEQTKSKDSRRKEIIMIREEINETEMTKTMENIDETKSWFLEKINKIAKTLVKLINKKLRGPKSIKSETKKSYKNTIDTKDHKRIL